MLSERDILTAMASATTLDRARPAAPATEMPVSLCCHHEISKSLLTITPDPCPSDSFCLINGLCCPDVSHPPLLSSLRVHHTHRAAQGLPASTCAAQNGVTLPDNFDAKTATQAGSTTAHTSTISAVQTATGSVTSSAFVPSTTATTVATPYPIPSNATTPSGTASGSGAGAGPTGGVTPFVGGAASVKVACGGVLAGLLGVAALL